MAGLTWEQVQQIYKTQAGWDFNKIDPTALQSAQYWIGKDPALLQKSLQKTPVTPKKPTTPTTVKKTTPQTSIVPGPTDPKLNQINIADWASKVAADPSLGMRRDDPKTKNVNESQFLSDHVPTIDPNTSGTNINGAASKYQMNPTGVQASTSTVSNTAQASEVNPQQAQGYTADTTADKVAQQDMTAAQGQVDPRANVEAPQIDMKGTATGTNADGSINYTGQALQDYATQDLNAVDPKATLKGQLGELQSEFVGPNGEPKIPTWAAGAARSVSRIAAFKGMTGTAATAAMAQALHEASITVAQQDAQFFQTLTIQNLNNKQASTINRANVLAKMDQVNADSRLAAAIQNSKNFMDMDLANLSNEQQARVINTQDRVQSILEDSKATNAARLFGAEQANDFAKFYDQLNADIEKYNSSQVNSMNQFNAGEKNATSKFNADLANQREQFYKTMQYNIDVSNAKWRQTVTLQNAQMKFDAAALDVKNMTTLQQEQLNQIWDRSDALLDYLWKSTENEKDRQVKLATAKMDLKAKDNEGLGTLFGTLFGAGVDKLFSFL